MIKRLILGVALATNVIAATDFYSGDEISIKLQTAYKRKIYAEVFLTMAQQAVEIGDEERVQLNNSLVERFEEMKKNLTTSKLVALHTIETKEKATAAYAYYKEALGQIDTFIRLLEKQLNRLLSEDFE